MQCNVFKITFSLYVFEHFSEEHGERVHQDVAAIERRYEEMWKPTMLANYC